ncbi:hypothetical protein PHLCEN_2v9947 [Hermanssonia centrifuga]|uniref:FAD/NAD(P)-binding domain-containing protein n=1 Tax=Hermanssonia centrifuga TaxID=98765 RepID=A0A2R6NPE2_9APHY|nr:hypothetical protein PHLCEN_2v9947 [Hermanssonia centrifuga]
MSRVFQLAFLLLSLAVCLSTQHATRDAQTVLAAGPPHRNVTKSIAIVGAGSGGLAVLKTLLDLPEEVRSSWEFALYEQHRDVGGLWLPDPNPPHPPALPETPLYPRLRTNTPHPTMTYPGFTFRPGTPLFPTHNYVQQYHADFAEHFNLSSYIHLNHTVLATGWRGNNTHGEWVVDVEYDLGTKVYRRSFDHLIVANGHNHYPRIPHWPGEEDWLASSPTREILHSIFYRNPERYTNQTVIVVGGGASGRDAALQIGPLAKTYQSLREGSVPPDGAQVTVKPPISHFTNTSVVFEDGTSLTSVDSLVLATGYEFRVPFLAQSPPTSGIVSPALEVAPSTTANSTTAQVLTSNLRYIFPLYEHIFSLSPAHPPTALAFVGLPVLIANCPSDRAQALLVAHAIADPTILPSRDGMFTALLRREDNMRQRGYDPYVYGHKMVGGDTEAQDYQNALVRYLKQHGKLPDDGKDYVESWRKASRVHSALLARGWTRIESEGEQQKWLEGVETEDEWADLMQRLAAWQEEWENEHGQGLDEYAAV